MARYATARYSVKEAREATWARRVALFFVQLMILHGAAAPLCVADHALRR